MVASTYNHPPFGLCPPSQAIIALPIRHVLFLFRRKSTRYPELRAHTIIQKKSLAGPDSPFLLCYVLSIQSSSSAVPVSYVILRYRLVYLSLSLNLSFSLFISSLRSLFLIRNLIYYLFFISAFGRTTLIYFCIFYFLCYTTSLRSTITLSPPFTTSPLRSSSSIINVPHHPEAFRPCNINPKKHSTHLPTLPLSPPQRSIFISSLYPSIQPSIARRCLLPFGVLSRASFC